MRLSRTLGFGAALAVLPLVAALAFTVDRLQELASRSERLMLRQLSAVRLGTGVATRLDRLSELLSKHAVSRDAGYAQKFSEVAEAIDAELEALRDADLGDGEDARLAEFVTRWRAFREHALAQGPDAVQQVEALAQSARALLASAHRAAEEDVARAEEAREAAGRAAVTATLVALLSSGVVLLSMTRWLRRRLAAFVDATDAVGRGAFSAQLPFAGDDELGRVAVAFNGMVSALQGLEKMKADFLSSISHELRTPLVAMVETNEALLDDVAGPLTERQRRMITLNAGAARRLSAMIGDLLELSVVRSGMRYQMEPMPLGQVVNDAVSELDSRARERGLTLEVAGCESAGALTVNADRGRIAQVVQNLVENAIKHTPAAGRIEVSLHARTEGAGAMERVALLRVDDTGPGIPETDRERVFEKFFRRQGVSADGVGLGLAICREIVHAHRGAIWIEDGRLGGASVCVALPVSNDQREAA